LNKFGEPQSNGKYALSNERKALLNSGMSCNMNCATLICSRLDRKACGHHHL
jgi:hypothetical protein